MSTPHSTIINVCLSLVNVKYKSIVTSHFICSCQGAGCLFEKSYFSCNEFASLIDFAVFFLLDLFLIVE